MDQLTDLVHSKFSSIKNTGRKAEIFSGQPCLPEHLQVNSIFSVKHPVIAICHSLPVEFYLLLVCGVLCVREK